MMRFGLPAMAIAGTLTIAACAMNPTNGPDGVHSLMTSKGTVLADARGMTLYTFDRDTTPGKSACNGQCATNWPPMMASAGAAPTAGFTVITRDDGGKQWAYMGKPLYRWARDAKPGDTTGDGVIAAWWLARP